VDDDDDGDNFDEELRVDDGFRIIDEVGLDDDVRNGGKEDEVVLMY